MGDEEFNARVNKYDQDSGLGENASQLNFGDEPEQSFIDFGDDSFAKEKKSDHLKSANTGKNSLKGLESQRSRPEFLNDKRESERPRSSNRGSNFGSA